jgi:hypothetical protein
MREYQGQLEGVFGNAWRIAGGSMLAFWAGSFSNSYVLAKMKIWSQGRWLWSRTIGSTLVGELVDSSFFYFIAFYGIWETGDIVKVTLAQYVLKTGWEAVMTPVTYRVVGFLKKAEQEDYYDTNTDFTPFSVKVLGASGSMAGHSRAPHVPFIIPFSGGGVGANNYSPLPTFTGR